LKLAVFGVRVDAVLIDFFATEFTEGIPKILRYSFVDLIAVASGSRHEERWYYAGAKRRSK
jgi:hypothetical protein